MSVGLYYLHQDYIFERERCTNLATVGIIPYYLLIVEQSVQGIFQNIPIGGKMYSVVLSIRHSRRWERGYNYHYRFTRRRRRRKRNR